MSRRCATAPAGAGATYGASLAGSAAGAALALPLLAQVGSAATILLAAALGVAAPVVAAPRLAAIGAGLASIALVVGAIVIAPAGPRVSIHSQLAQALQRPDTRRLDTKLSANSRVDILQNAGFRTTTGLSLNYAGSRPPAPHRPDGRRRKRGGAGRPRCRGPGPGPTHPRHRHTTRCSGPATRSRRRVRRRGPPARRRRPSRPHPTRRRPAPSLARRWRRHVFSTTVTCASWTAASARPCGPPMQLRPGRSGRCASPFKASPPAPSASARPTPSPAMPSPTAGAPWPPTAAWS